MQPQNKRQEAIRKFAKALAAVAFWILIWFLAAYRYGNPLLFPSPVEVLRSLWGLMQTGIFYRATGKSLLNVTLGILIAVATGTVLSVVTAKVPFAKDLLIPLMTVVKATPVASFIVLALFFLGSAKVSVFITVLIVLPVVWTNLDVGFSKIDPGLRQVTEVFRLPLSRRVRILILPSLTPYFVSALRTSLGLAWKAGIAAEIIAMPRTTIGTQIGNAKQYLETTEMFAWTLTVVLLSLMIEGIVTALFRLYESKRRKGEA